MLLNIFVFGAQQAVQQFEQQIYHMSTLYSNVVSNVLIFFSFCQTTSDYKVDCACYKGNQNCPVQKHNLSPKESFLNPSTLLSLTPVAGAETRQRKARRKEMEGSLVNDSNQVTEDNQEAKKLQGTSDTEVCVCVCLLHNTQIGCVGFESSGRKLSVLTDMYCLANHNYDGGCVIVVIN